MKTILVPVDFSQVTEQSVNLAGNLAIAVGAKVVLVHVAVAAMGDFAVGADTAMPAMSREQYQDQLKGWRGQLQGLCDRLTARGCDAQPVLAEGPVISEICKQVAEHEADMVVIGSHGHGQLHDLLMGSISQGVIRKAGVPVLVVPSAKRGNGE